MSSGTLRLLFACALCAATALPAAAMPGMPAGHPAVSTPDRTLFELIAAGVALHRGEAGFAYAAWMDAAETTKNPGVAQLAWETAVSARDSEKTLAAARLWLKLDPAAEGARQTLLADAVERGDAPAVRSELAAMEKALAPRDAKAGDWLNRLIATLGPSTQKSRGIRALADALGPYAARHAARPDVQIGYAQILAAAGRGAEACRRAEAAAGRARGDAELLGRAADTCWPVDQMKTRAMLESHLKRHPDDAFVLLIYARVEQRLGRRAQAVEALDRAMKKPAEDPRIPFNAGQLAADLHEPQRTEKYFSEYVRLLREQSGGEADLSRLEVWLRMGEAALTQQAPARAAEYFAQLQSGPFAAQARIHEALALADLGRGDEALERLERGRKALPLDAPVLYGAESQLLLELGRPADALALMRKAVVEHPDEPDVLYETAMLEENAGDSDAAEKHLRALITLSPAHVQGLNALGYLYTVRNAHLKEARELLERAYKAEPLDPYILDSMGWLSFREGRFRAAAEFTATSLKRLWDEEVAAHLVEILAADGRRAEAEAALGEMSAHGSAQAAAKLAARLGLTPPPAAGSAK